MHRVSRWRDLFLGVELSGASPLAPQTINYTTLPSYRRNWRWCLCAVGIRWPTGRTYSVTVPRSNWDIATDYDLVNESGGNGQLRTTGSGTPNEALAFEAVPQTTTYSVSQQTDDGNRSVGIELDTLDGTDPTGTIQLTDGYPTVELDWLLSTSWQGQIRVTPDAYSLAGSGTSRPVVWARVRPVTRRELRELQGDEPGHVGDAPC